MSEFLSRAFTGDISIRSEAGGRTLYGIVVPYNRVARVSDGGPAYDEAFQHGVFAKHLAERTSPIKLLSQHRMNENPLGKSTLLREDAAGLYGEFWMHDTTEARDAMNLAADGALSFSIGFRPVKHVKRDGIVWRTEAAAREASLVTFPAYEDALVGGIRAAVAAAGDDTELVGAILDALDDVPAEVAIRALSSFAKGRALPPHVINEAVAVLLPAGITATTPEGEPERSTDEPAVDATQSGASPTSARNRITVASSRVITHTPVKE